LTTRYSTVSSEALKRARWRRAQAGGKEGDHSPQRSLEVVWV